MIKGRLEKKDYPRVDFEGLKHEKGLLKHMQICMKF
jgi:hypothetical protein